VTIFAPLIAGLLIDKTRKIWVWMLIFPVIPILAVLIPIYQNHSKLSLYLTYKEMCAFGNSGFLVC